MHGLADESDVDVERLDQHGRIAASVPGASRGTGQEDRTFAEKQSRSHEPLQLVPVQSTGLEQGGVYVWRHGLAGGQLPDHLAERADPL
ncbi:hypothetical protein AB0L35_37915 [Streptomyces sp. NPDC052309]|uniref:hypothetical protein n=1 Tax=Streptomyces sp. NPDC052309 TaxID=3155421 RepID=UPI003418608E